MIRVDPGSTWRVRGTNGSSTRFATEQAARVVPARLALAARAAPGDRRARQAKLPIVIGNFSHFEQIRAARC
jgi:hypothetical protein